MAYEPTKWEKGDVITAEKLNKIENAMGVLIITDAGEKDENGVIELSATPRQVHDAVENGRLIVLRYIGNSGSSFYYLSSTNPIESEEGPNWFYNMFFNQLGTESKYSKNPLYVTKQSGDDSLDKPYIRYEVTT